MQGGSIFERCDLTCLGRRGGGGGQFSALALASGHGAAKRRRCTFASCLLELRIGLSVWMLYLHFSWAVFDLLTHMYTHVACRKLSGSVVPGLLDFGCGSESSCQAGQGMGQRAHSVCLAMNLKAPAGPNCMQQGRKILYRRCRAGFYCSRSADVQLDLLFEHASVLRMENVSLVPRPSPASGAKVDLSGGNLAQDQKHARAAVRFPTNIFISWPSTLSYPHEQSQCAVYCSNLTCPPRGFTELWSWKADTFSCKHRSPLARQGAQSSSPPAGFGGGLEKSQPRALWNKVTLRQTNATCVLSCCKLKPALP